mgnify:CR=1 FL=1
MKHRKISNDLECSLASHDDMPLPLTTTKGVASSLTRNANHKPFLKLVAQKRSDKFNFLPFPGQLSMLGLGFLMFMTTIVTLSVQLHAVSYTPLFPDSLKRRLQGSFTDDSLRGSINGVGSSRTIVLQEKHQKQQEAPASWDNFDRIVCLNVKERTDRLAYAKQEFERIGVLDRIQFRIAPKHPGGCFEAHWRAIQDAYDDHVENLFIFEDDVYFGPGWQGVINDSNDFVKQEPGWEFLSMGYVELYVEASQSSETIFSGKATSGHAVVLSRAGMERFLQRVPSPYGATMESDIMYMVHLARSYVHPEGRNTITQLREELGTDNLWSFVVEKDKENDDARSARYKEVFQNTFVPSAQSIYGDLEMFCRHLPYALRPWLIPNNVSMKHKGDGGGPSVTTIPVFRNGVEEEFPFQVGAVPMAILVGVGFYTALTAPMPEYVSRFTFLLYITRFSN